MRYNNNYINFTRLKNVRKMYLSSTIYHALSTFLI